MGMVDLNLMNDEYEKIMQIIVKNAKTRANIKDIINVEINEFKASDTLKWMRIGERYYRNDPDIKDRVRKAVGESGALEPVANLANNKLANPFVRKLVNQKVGYLLSLPMSVQTENEKYQKLWEQYVDKKFLRQIQSLGTEAINKGIAWLHLYYDENGKLQTMIVPSEQCIPIWMDAAHTELNAMIRFYDVQVLDGKEQKTITKVEWWDTEGVYRFISDGGDLIPDVDFMFGVGKSVLDALGDATEEGRFPHFIMTDGENTQGYNFARVPFIAFKYNDDELPLVKFIKELVDDYDKQKSDVANNLEDLPNSIYKVKNYGDVNGGEFRRNIALYRTVFVEGDGDVDTINLEIDTETYRVHQEQNRRDIYEFGRGVDTQIDKLGNASGVALKFLYADLDMDCNIIENQFQAALEQLKWFVDTDLARRGEGEFFDEQVEFIFNRDILINETEVVENLRNSMGILSEETLVAQHPWVISVQDELDRIRKERQERLEEAGSYKFPTRTEQSGEDE